jgi:hypothetical protein
MAGCRARRRRIGTTPGVRTRTASRMATTAPLVVRVGTIGEKRGPWAARTGGPPHRPGRDGACRRTTPTTSAARLTAEPSGIEAGEAARRAVPCAGGGVSSLGVSSLAAGCRAGRPRSSGGVTRSDEWAGTGWRGRGGRAACGVSACALWSGLPPLRSGRWAVWRRGRCRAGPLCAVVCRCRTLAWALRVPWGSPAQPATRVSRQSFPPQRQLADMSAHSRQTRHSSGWRERVARTSAPMATSGENLGQPGTSGERGRPRLPRVARTPAPMAVAPAAQVPPAGTSGEECG